ncbi:MAG TPA: PIN domain-containing protein [Ilumatobacter sp.]|nr:PIN domain-containing protein [Ilumatobacter sp.]
MVDTSVAVPALQASHSAHHHVMRHLAGLELGLSAHAAIETYSVLTRLPGDARLDTADAATLIAQRFLPIVALDSDMSEGLIQVLADHRVAGGAVYDALIALTSIQAGATLLTRDRRARATYVSIGAAHELVT